MYSVSPTQVIAIFPNSLQYQSTFLRTYVGRQYCQVAIILVGSKIPETRHTRFGPVETASFLGLDVVGLNFAWGLGVWILGFGSGRFPIFTAEVPFLGLVRSYF